MRRALLGAEKVAGVVAEGVEKATCGLLSAGVVTQGSPHEMRAIEVNDLTCEGV